MNASYTLPPVISLIVPMHDEAGALDAFFAQTEAVLAGTGLSYEILCVNDGSRDATLEGLLAHRHRNSAIRIIDLSRNFGKEAALSAGLDYCRGEAVIPIDADLQDPPELIPAMLARWREGHEVVYASRASRASDSWFKRRTADWFYRLHKRLADIDIPPNVGDFRLLDRAVVESLKRLPERNRFMKGLFTWVGFRQTLVEYDRPPRAAGYSKWSYWRLWNFALDGITAFSTMPLRIWSYLGLVISLLAFGYATFLIGRTLLLGVDVPGYASMMAVVLFLGGVQLIGLGVIGEYLGRLFQEVKARPLYLIRCSYGLEDETGSVAVDPESIGP